MADSFNSSTNESTSTSGPVQSPENDISNQLSSVASGLANQMLGWANQVFAQTSSVTNQAVGNFFQVSQKMLGLSNNLTDQYNNLFAPENAQLVADANSYASPARMAVDMGQAGATQAQAGDQALKNSEEALRSYGIDPSSGRYAALDKAAAVQNAANVAGAMNTQRNADIATGQRLRSEAVQVGAQLPAAIANVNNTAIQANTGASNASLANANTGKNLMELPNDYLKTAKQILPPSQGSNSQSQGHSNGFSTSPDRQGGSGGGGGSGPINPGVNPGGGQPWMPQHTGYQGDGGTRPGGSNQNPSSRITPVTGNDWGGQSDLLSSMYDNLNGSDFSGYDSGYGNVGPQTTDSFDYGNGTNMLGNEDWGNGQTWGADNTQGWGGSSFDPGGTSGGGGSDQSGWGAYNYDPNSNQFDPNAYGGSPQDGGTSGWQDPPPQINTDPTIWGDSGGSSPDYGGGGGGNYSPPPDYGSYTAPSDDYDMGGAYAKGGPVGGGRVPARMSPSGGQRVDDIPAMSPKGPARLNANEFVIPQDVALWKGQEFFQNLIDQSRKKRVTAPAQGGQKPQQAMR
jgi:hypothetical protein